MKKTVESHKILHEKEVLSNLLLEWYESNGRHWIPWKLTNGGSIPKNGEFLSIYSIWIAEVMLQQTRLNVVAPYWRRWMDVFPSLVDLASADEQKLLLNWQGLGYYSRARRIHKSANLLLEKIGGTQSLDPNLWPKDLSTWIALPGIGRTTAGSILSSAFNLPFPILDGNVKRILTRLIASKIPLESNESILWFFTEELLDRQNPRKFNQALMDLGATICTPKKPNCLCCPWQNHCIAYSSGDPVEFPVKYLPKEIPLEVIGIGIVVNLLGEVLIDQRLDDGLLGGMWEFPGGKQEYGEPIKKTIVRELKEELAIEVKVEDRLISLDHAYSHKKLRFIVHMCKLLSGEPKALASKQFKWVLPKELSKYPFPAANIKIIDELNQYFMKDKIEKTPRIKL